MANATIQVVDTGKTYVIKGFMRLTWRKSQQTPPFPIPTQADDKAVLTALMGQQSEFMGEFIIIDRTGDDYTNGTGSPSTYSIDEQRNYIMDTIFTPGGVHRLTDEQGNVFSGRIQDVEFVKMGDDPMSDSVVFRFIRGLAFTA